MNTKQQEFDAVVAHLYKQGRPAFNDDRGGCLYRSTEIDGTVLSCAVGCRIPDSVYVPDMDKGIGLDGTGIDSLMKRFGDVLPKEFRAYQGMFLDLQRVHDYYDAHPFDSTLGERLAGVALKHHLNFTIPTEGGK